MNREVTTTYDRPVKATLHVHLENGETWPATDEDLVRFGLDFRHCAYMRFNDALVDTLEWVGLLGNDVIDVELNAVRYLAEIAICHPHLLDHPEHGRWESVANLERALRARLSPSQSTSGEDQG